MTDPLKCFVYTCTMANIPFENIMDLREICEAHCKAEHRTGNLTYTLIDSLKEFVKIVRLHQKVKQLKNLSKKFKLETGDK